MDIFAPFRAISHQIEKCYFAESNIRNRSPDPQKGSKMVKNRVLRGFLTGSEGVHGLKGRYIVTFGQEAVRGPQKRSKMSIFLLKMVQNHQKSRNLLKCASKQRVQIHGFLKTTKRS